ncbi:hypothetical protein [uncultured Paraglaciecola sp.]|uniref:hypothetical protein n=1 Tax=uncultured Paraglaciecola sp. TaxID=1765024 RepID=UPI00260A1621|nr:hypothetical protein [uncultured Paraglaciecola sp.]
MIKPIIYASLLICCSCSTSFVVTNTFLEQRSPVAISLEEQQRYADALTQWKILALTYPEDEAVNSHVKRLESLISARVSKQFRVLKKAQGANNKKLQHQLYLKILALEPNNKIAMQELRKFEWQDVIKQASSKTANIKKYFVKSQQEANDSILLSRYLEQGKQFTHQKNYQELLQLADKFEKDFPAQQHPNNYRTFAFFQLAERYQKQKSHEKAIEYYQKALDIAALQGKSLPNAQKSRDSLSKSTANKYLKIANSLLKTDLDAAIENAALSLKYQPNNVKARTFMKRALIVKKNLNRIRGIKVNLD